MNLEALLQDESFAKAVENAENLDEIAGLFNSRGIDVSSSDIQKAMDAVQNGELSESNLEAVAGGVVTPVVVSAAIIGAYVFSKWKRTWKR